MRSLIRRFDMDEDHVVVLERLDGGCRLALVVGVEQPRGAGHLDQIEAHQLGESAHQIDGGNRCAA